jgi:hypothetical protein
LNVLAFGQSMHTAFTDLSDWTLLPSKKLLKVRAAKSTRHVPQSPESNQLIELITIIGETSECMHDSPRELYMNAISNGHIKWYTGQFVLTCLI